MDIFFINPPWHKEAGNIWKTVGSCQPPFGLALLAALVREKGYSTGILDCNALQLDLNKIIDNLPPEPPKFIGITATSVLIDNAIEIAKIIKNKYSETKVIIGGVHATVLPEETLSSPYVDFIVIGEGEYSLLELLSGEEPKNIGGLGWKEKGESILNPSRCIIPDIDIFPLLAYDLLPMNKYYPAAGSYIKKPAIGMISSRGCPGRCTFCKGNVLGDRIRFRSAEKIIEEIELLQKKYGVKEIQFYDDTFTANRLNLKKFCNLILEKKLKISWCCFSRVDTVDKETLALMKKAHCHQVMFGVESADQTILNNINKKITFEKVEYIVQAAKDVGITVRLAFMYGNPGETEETMEKNIQYAIKLNPDLVSFNITTPYPGTEMFKWAKENGYLIHTRWKDYDLSRPIMRLPTVSEEKILKYYKESHKKFYLRPKYILSRIKKDLKNPSLFLSDLKSFIGLVKFSAS